MTEAPPAQERARSRLGSRFGSVSVTVATRLIHRICVGAIGSSGVPSTIGNASR